MNAVKQVFWARSVSHAGQSINFSFSTNSARLRFTISSNEVRHSCCRPWQPPWKLTYHDRAFLLTCTQISHISPTPDHGSNLANDCCTRAMFYEFRSQHRRRIYYSRARDINSHVVRVCIVQLLTRKSFTLSRRRHVGLSISISLSCGEADGGGVRKKTHYKSVIWFWLQKLPAATLEFMGTAVQCRGRLGLTQNFTHFRVSD